MATPQVTNSFLDELDVLQAVLKSLAVGVAVCDVYGKLVFFNPEAERILGMSLEEVESAEWTAASGCYRADRVTLYPADELPLARALRGEEVLQQLVYIRNAHQPAGVWISVSGRPVRDRMDTIRGAVAVFRDLTEAHDLLSVRGSATLVADTARDLALVPPCEKYLDRLFAFRDHLTRLSAAVEQTADGVLITDNRGVIEYVNPAFEATSGYAAGEVLGKTPSILKSGQHDEQFYGELWSQVLAGRPFRATIVNRKKSGELYWAEQTISPIRNAGQQITHFVSVLKDVTELRKKQEQDFHMEFARQVQQRFYRPVIQVPGFDIAGTARPAAQTGGDYLDFIPQPDGSVYLAIGDVCGHGFDAALLMATARAYTRAWTSLASNPAAVIEGVNRSLAADLAQDQFFTLLLVRLDPRAGSLQYAGAGHIPGYVLDAFGNVRALLESTAPPCGMFSTEHQVATGLIPLYPGETVLMLTDGVTEATDRDSAEFGSERALDVGRAYRNRSAHELVEAILASTQVFAGTQPHQDDAAVVVCKVGNPGP